MVKGAVCLFHTTVDYEIATMLLAENGYTVVDYPFNAELIVVDTTVLLNKEYVSQIHLITKISLLGFENNLLFREKKANFARMDCCTSKQEFFISRLSVISEWIYWVILID